MIMGCKNSQYGFTLIELMVTVIIIAILTAIAIPSYERYAVKNAESELQSYVGQLEIELNRWRASSLSYRGFKPINGASASGVTYGYASNNGLPSHVAVNSVIYLPLGSNIKNYRYLIELVDGSSNPASAISLVPASSNVNIAIGRSWNLVAYPNQNLKAKGARRFFASSNGIRCSEPELSRLKKISIAGCRDGADSW